MSKNNATQLIISVNDYTEYLLVESLPEVENDKKLPPPLPVCKYTSDGKQKTLKSSDNKAVNAFLEDIEKRIKVSESGDKKYYYVDISDAVKNKTEESDEVDAEVQKKQIIINKTECANKQIKSNKKDVYFIKSSRKIEIPPKQENITDNTTTENENNTDSTESESENDSDKTASKNKKETDNTKTAIRFGNIVGVLRWKNYNYKKGKYDITLQIGSRFDTKDKKYLLPTMLYHRADTLSENNFVPSGDDDVFHFLYLFIFKEKLKEAYQNGAYKTYVRFERNDSKLRGSIDISRHIKLNAGQNNGKIAYSFRESTIDNPINHLILHTYDYAKKVYPDLLYDITSRDFTFNEIIKTIRYQANTYDSSAIQKCIQSCGKQIAHPFFIKYEETRKICLNFLHFMGVSMFDGDEEEQEVQGILYDVNDLWEEYLAKCFEKNLKSDYKVCNQFGVPVCIDENGNDKTSGYPDHVFFDKDSDVKNDPAKMVLDAKYRIVWQNNGFDFPDYTKCIRDMNAFAAHKTGVIYPQEIKDKSNTEVNADDAQVNTDDIQANADDTQANADDAQVNTDDIRKSARDIQEEKLIDSAIKFQVSKYNKDDYFYSIPVCIPCSDENTSYYDWRKKMDDNIDIVTDKIKEILGQE